MTHEQAIAAGLNRMRVQGRQIGALDAIITDCGSRSRPLESALEVVVWRLIKGHDLPTPIPAWEFEDDVGQPFRVDFAFPVHELAIECDGWETHGDRDAFESDRLRTQRLAALGWRVMAVTWKQVTEEPRKFLALLRQALAPDSST